MVAAWVMLRLFVISIIIVIAIIESPVSAYSLRPKPRQQAQLPNEDLAAVETTLNETKNVSTTTDANKVIDAAKEIATSTSAKIYEVKGEPSKIVDKVELTTAFILLKTDDGYLKITGLPIYTSSIKGTDSISSPETTQLPDKTNNQREIIKKDDSITTNDPRETIAIDSDFTSISSIYSTGTSSSDVPTQEAPVEITTTLEDNTFSETKSTEPIIATRKSISTASHSTIPDETSGTSSASSLSSKESDTEPSQENTLTFTPSWKKYTTIDRKRDSQMSTSSTGQDVETSPTRISLEKLLTDTSISSLGQLGASLGSKTTYAFDVSSTSPFIQEASGIIPEVSTTDYTSTTTKQTSPRALQITSKRAGFLDYSAKPIAEEATTVIENFDIPDKNESRGFSSMFEFEPENDSKSKNNTGVASQSQLAEDVMREEMMKEEMMNNEKENAKRYKETDQLSVKPIDKTTLYSVGPNYKPMKKLDVQPAKPFLRDPDDLSWRNESISSLGIVFKANPAAKNFTQVLKNKTETLFSNVTDKESKNDVPDLRERLEKIAEVRKSKKKKVIDKFGETIYTDYEENSSSAETTSASTTANVSTLPTTKLIENPVPPTDEPNVTTHVSVKKVYQNSPVHETETPKAPKKLIPSDYYDVTDEYDNDYLNFQKIDLKKFTTRLTTKDTPRTTFSMATSPFQKPSTQYWPDRKPTLQYFPPRPTTSQKLNVQADQGYDEHPINKLNYYTLQDTTKNLIPVAVTFTTVPAPTPRPTLELQRDKPPPPLAYKYKNDLAKTVYFTQSRGAPVAGPVTGYEDGRFNRPTYVIKHFKDLIEKASKDNDYDNKDTQYDDVRYTQTPSPLRSATAGDLTKSTQKINLPEDYDYDTGYRKDVLTRFVDNFNQNSERFKVDFPILYNSSVVHRKPEEHGNSLATSSAFLKRLYDDMSPAKPGRGRDCDGCERNVELPPEYELHYYIPEQEEREEAELRSPSSYRYSIWDGHSQR